MFSHALLTCSVDTERAKASVPWMTLGKGSLSLPSNGDMEKPSGFNSLLRRLSRAPLEPPMLNMPPQTALHGGGDDVVGVPLLDLNGHVAAPLEPLDEDEDDDSDSSSCDWLDHTAAVFPARDSMRHAPSLASINSRSSNTSSKSPVAGSRLRLQVDDPRSRRQSTVSQKSCRSTSTERLAKASSLPDITQAHGARWQDVEAAMGDEPGESCSPSNLVNQETEMVYKTLTRKLLFLNVARSGGLFSQRTRERLVFKSGECNISNANVHQRRFRYIVDIFTTLLELSWGYSILLYTLSFFISWSTFGLCWWAIGSLHSGNADRNDTCVDGVEGYTSALLFSIETQQTIGYGTRAVTTECSYAIIIMMLQSVFGVVLECVMTGLIFAKLALPKRRAETIMFSKTAVICQHKGNLCLVFRVGDMRKNHMIDVNLNAVMVKQRKKSTKKEKEKDENETPLRQYKLELQAESEDFYFLAWPIHVLHVINEESPLWEMTPERLMVSDFEIIVVLEGIIESSGMTTQVRTSYLPSEITWGHKLATLLTYQKDNGQYKIDYTQFHTTVPVDTPDMSASELAELNRYRAQGRRMSLHHVPHPAHFFKPQVSMVCETEEDDDNNNT